MGAGAYHRGPQRLDGFAHRQAGFGEASAQLVREQGPNVAIPVGRLGGRTRHALADPTGDEHRIKAIRGAQRLGHQQLHGQR